ncbi:hypothetical protein [Nocardia tengchongensis]|uniref:hypothetical protein n=1 Tax=Nocardia tengchongensis TaxID=2055889 RepID=UPI0036B7EF13
MAIVQHREHQSTRFGEMPGYCGSTGAIRLRFSLFRNISATLLGGCERNQEARRRRAGGRAPRVSRTVRQAVRIWSTSSSVRAACSENRMIAEHGNDLADQVGQVESHVPQPVSKARADLPKAGSPLVGAADHGERGGQSGDVVRLCGCRVEEKIAG